MTEKNESEDFVDELPDEYKDEDIKTPEMTEKTEQKEIAEEYMNTVKLEIKQKKHNLTLIK